jgi:MFS family permease
MSYSSSLFYGLSANDNRGANAGTHEMLVGSAFTFGPLLAGLVAQKVNLKAAFFLAAVVIAIGCAAQVCVAKMLNRRRERY